MYQVDELIERFISVRKKTIELCKPLEIEDYVVQPSAEVSPPKWHLGHTTWFFEELILKKIVKNYFHFDEGFPKIFNSYYKSAGEHWLQSDRGCLSRPTVKRIFEYRKFIDDEMIKLLKNEVLSSDLLHLLEVGLNHEQQHQELLLMDIKYILALNPSRPNYFESNDSEHMPIEKKWLEFSEGVYETGHSGDEFAYDNETPRHKNYLHPYGISENLITNGEYLKFIEDGGYQNPKYWLSLGWDWICSEQINSPLYWREYEGSWFEYKLDGDKGLDLDEPVMHISYFEADAFANWSGHRLPTEHELEIFYKDQKKACGKLWTWTKSHYSPYPGYKCFEGMIEEYNGKFMCNQFVLRGGCFATPENHYRQTYRNFYAPHQRWMFSGIRLAK